MKNAHFQNVLFWKILIPYLLSLQKAKTVDILLFSLCIGIYVQKPQLKGSIHLMILDKVLQYYLKIKRMKKKHSECRKKWSNDELEQLKVIYNEEILKGYKELWKRISQRVNNSVRKGRRQAIEYKWKNYCNENKIRKNPICKNNRLIEELLERIPFEGYSSLAKHQPFIYISESSLKNIFYSTIRSVNKIITKQFPTKIWHKSICPLFFRRDYLLFLHTKDLNFVTFRRSLIEVKSLRKSKISNQSTHRLNELTAIIETFMNQLYHKCWKQTTMFDMNEYTESVNESFSCIQPQIKEQQMIYKMQFIDENDQKEILPSSQSTVPLYQKKDVQYCSIKSYNSQIQINLQSHSSFSWLINDF